MSQARLQPAARCAVEHAAGCAVFSTAGIKQLLAGRRQGRGMVVSNRTRLVKDGELN